MKSQLGILAGVAAATLFSSAALADSMPETHDGFFLRLGLNLGPASATRTAEFNGTEVGGEATLSGFSGGFDLMMGGTPADGLVIGGALTTITTSDPDVESGGRSASLDGTMIFAGIGVFANYYLNPNEGLHFQGLLGFGTVDLVDSDGNSGGNDPSGPYFGVGVGYDFWVSDEWSIGPFGRVLYAATSYEEGGGKLKVNYLYPSIGAAFTYH